MYLVDTNIFLEVMLSRKRKKECKALLRELMNGRIRGVVTDFSVHSIMIIMEGFGKLSELEVFLRSLRRYKGLYVYKTSIADNLKAVKICKDKGLDIDDAIQYAAALSINAEAIVSFDSDFDGLKIPRIEPYQIIKRQK
ncbi:MAG: type II toxin-antitoxin system VapC family toxin [Candidatus Baldrarchaeia archaeon]